MVQLLRKGTSRSALLMAELRQVWALLHTLRVDLVPVYIASGDNPADFPSRHSLAPAPAALAPLLAVLAQPPPPLQGARPRPSSPRLGRPIGPQPETL